MAAALWMIRYALDGAEDAAYLDWFHGEHIPEKRARPGYAWAAHYADGSGRYLALFAAEDARTFLDPTPGQWKLRQDETTRRMSAHRREATAAVLVEVLRDGHGTQPPGAVRLCALEPADDAAVAAAVQAQLPALAHANGCRWAALLVPVLGPGGHWILEARDAPGATARAAPAWFEGARIDGA